MKKPAVVSTDSGKDMNILGHSVTVKLDRAQTNGDYYVFEVISPPNAGIPPHVHEHEDEVIFIVEGTYSVTIDTETIIAGPGATLHFARHAPHSFANIGETPGRTLWTVMPGDNFESFFDELGALPADSPPDFELVAAIFDRYDIALLPQPVSK